MNYVRINLLILANCSLQHVTITKIMSKYQFVNTKNYGSFESSFFYMHLEVKNVSKIFNFSLLSGINVVSIR